MATFDPFNPEELTSHLQEKVRQDLVRQLLQSYINDTPDRIIGDNSKIIEQIGTRKIGDSKEEQINLTPQEVGGFIINSHKALLNASSHTGPDNDKNMAQSEIISLQIFKAAKDYANHGADADQAHIHGALKALDIELAEHGKKSASNPEIQEYFSTLSQKINELNKAIAERAVRKSPIPAAVAEAHLVDLPYSAPPSRGLSTSHSSTSLLDK